MIFTSRVLEVTPSSSRRLWKILQLSSVHPQMGTKDDQISDKNIYPSVIWWRHRRTGVFSHATSNTGGRSGGINNLMTACS